jgi:hypothetical protein
MFFFFHQWQMCHDFKCFGQHIEVFMKKVKKTHVLGIVTDPDWHDLDADPDLDAAK